MHRVLTACIVAVLAGAAFADEASKAPDYSREALLRMVAAIPQPPPRTRNVKFHFGAVEFRALGMNWRIIYLPLVVPLSGSGMGTTRTLPDPFELTGTPFETPRRDSSARRQVRAELRRIEQTEREVIVAGAKR